VNSIIVYTKVPLILHNDECESSNMKIGHYQD